MNMAGLLSKKEGGGAPQSVKHPTLDLSSGLDLRVVESRPHMGFHAGCGAHIHICFFLFSPQLKIPGIHYSAIAGE